MSLPKICCTLPPVTSDYEEKGRNFKIGDLEIYETQDTTPKHLLICAYDIFGVHPNLRQVSDILAQAGFRIAIPNFFRENAIDKINFPPKDLQVLYDFIGVSGNWEKIVKPDLISVIKHYKEKENISSFGMFGFCWGARVCLDAMAQDQIPEIRATSLVHPSLWKTEDADLVSKPTLLLPAREDADMIPFYEILKKNLGEDKCGHRKFDDVPHGFMGARGDFNDALNVQRANEAIKLMQEFFIKHMK